MAETLLTGVTVNEIARRHSVKANHISACRTLAGKGGLAVPEIAGAGFAVPMSMVEPVEMPAQPRRLI